MRFVFVLVFVLAASQTFAQEAEVELQIGDLVEFGQCDTGSFEYIDLYVKTRFELDSISYDSIHEWEFYNRFFNTGDFDVSRLPCSYSGSTGVIKHMMAIQTEQNEWMNVILVMIRDGKSVAYIIEEAFLRGEVYFHSRP